MKINVLIIDSDIEVSKQIKYALQNPNTHVYCVVSMADALARFTSQRYEMVIMDISHAETDGLPFIRQLYAHRPIPITLLSTNHHHNESS